ncbi:MAG: hypothetical protein JSW11_09990 [Candidatus Heimdallarchaeota archaeon]|nr:MAG: hypothetical protein JSW11_09990 [Candidatus Heimdallarchaeota archaeon]
MLERGVLFTVFDQKQGLSIPIFYSGALNQEEANHVARRSQMTLTMMSSADLETAEAILPFSGLGKLGFILLFQIRQTNPEGVCVASLFYLVPQEQQVFLYNKVPFLKFKAEDLANKIKQKFVYTGQISFPKDLAQVLSEWQVSEKEATAEIQIIEKRVILSEKKEGGSVEFFLSQVKKNEDRVLGALFRGHPVFVTGQSDILVDLMVHSLDMVVPHVNLRKVSYTKEIIDPVYADIIGISQDLVKNYPNEVLVNIEKKQIKNGQPCSYSKKLIKQLRKNPGNIDTIVKESTEKLLRVVGMLVEAFSHSEDEKDSKLNEIQSTYDRDIIEVAAEIGAQRNPLIREVLLQQVSARFLDWMEGL